MKKALSHRMMVFYLANQILSSRSMTEKYRPAPWKHEGKGGDVNRVPQAEGASVVLTRAQGRTQSLLQQGARVPRLQGCPRFQVRAAPKFREVPASHSYVYP